MNWIKVSEKLPEFEKPVLLLEKREKGYVCDVGFLKSIDVDGNHWSIDYTFGIFFKEYKKFKPTHWC